MGNIFSFLSEYTGAAFSFMAQGDYITGMSLMGVTVVSALLALTFFGSLIWGVWSIIDDKNIKSNWGNFSPATSSQSDNEDSWSNFLMNVMFYSGVILSVIVVFGAVLQLFGLLFGFAANFWVPVVSIIGFVIAVYVLRAIKRLVKVTKAHVSNVAVHNKGILDETGLADKFTTDEFETLMTWVNKQK